MAPAGGVLRRVVKTGAAAADRLRAPAPGVVVLLYHRVGTGGSLEIDLPVDLFDEQMASIAGRVVPLGTALEQLSGPSRPSGEPALVVTFDDGTADFVDTALPVLERHRIPATLYLATRFVEEQRELPDDGRPVSWSALSDACTTGLVDIGSHTHEHRLMDRIRDDEICHELDRSIELIQDRLGRPAPDFAYPKAVAGSHAADREVRARFRSAALAGTRANRHGATDPFRLARSPVQRSDGMRYFRRKVDGGMALEDALRSALNRRRYANATS
jgi:peptidoglycan/xylan/chitin deacetylase (PgdA/CDA1 family)